MSVSAAQNQVTNPNPIQPEALPKPAVVVFTPKISCRSFFNNGRKLLLAGAVATTSVVLFTMISKRLIEWEKATQQKWEEAVKLAERNARLEKPCIVSNQKEFICGTKAQIAKCASQLFANSEDIEIKCDPQLVQDTVKALGLECKISCDETVKNNFTGHLVVTMMNNENDSLGESLVAAKQLSGFLEDRLVHTNDDLILTRNDAKVKRF
jgi:hypothetical protein